MADPTNPFGALTLIVAPAVLTNASSILVSEEAALLRTHLKNRLP